MEDLSSIFLAQTAEKKKAYCAKTTEEVMNYDIEPIRFVIARSPPQADDVAISTLSTPRIDKSKLRKITNFLGE